RKRRAGLVSILTVFVLVLSIVVLWQRALRVTHVTVTTGDTSLVPLATEALSGTYAFVIPRDSIIFLAAGSVRRAILSARPEIAAVSVSRNGFDSIAVKPEPRSPLARWCGTATSSAPANTALLDSMASPDGSCYLFDGGGFLYARAASAASSTATSTEDVGHSMSHMEPRVPYVVYAPFLLATSSPLGATVAHAADLPGVFDFSTQLRTLGAQVVSLVLRGDEVDLFLTSGTRVTYVLGDEQGAFSLLSATGNQISLKDGSLEYVDLRFPGKVFFKKNEVQK
ncbi:MAG TPA: hypothetical protein VF829_01280, partial [Candidatus Paceibacterota bacterium]